MGWGGVHFTTGQPDQNSNTFGHQMSLLGGRVRLTFCEIASQPASQPASQLQLAINQPCAKMSTCQTLGWSHSWQWEDWDQTTLDPSAGSQHSQWFPLEEWPTWPRSGRWHKWALQPLYIPLTLFTGTIYSFVSMSPNPPFSCTKCKRNAIKTIFCPGQFMHIIPPSIWCITTQRNYFLWNIFIIINRKCYGEKTKVQLTQSLMKCQPDPKPHLGGIHLTKGQHTWSSNTLCHKMSLPE